MPKQAASKTPPKPAKKAAKATPAKTASLKTSPVKAVSAKAAKAAKPSSAPPATHRQIAERAHHLWQQEGAHHGAHVDHWLQAEHQLKGK